jgi:hypothetical protein
MGLCAFIKTILRKITLLSQFCDSCGETNSPVWWASDELWEEVTGITDGSGKYCMRCFHKHALAKNISLLWKPEKTNVEKWKKDALFRVDKEDADGESQ